MMGDTIRSRRRELSITQEELADGACSRSYLSQIERNRRIPSPSIIADLARKLEIPLSEFTQYYLDRDSGVTSSRLLFMARVLALHGFMPDARQCLEEAGRQQMKASRNNHEFRCSYIKTEGSLAFRDGNHRDAMAKYLELVELCRRRPADTFSLAQSLFLAGNTAIHMNDYQTAKKLLFEALCHVLFMNADCITGTATRLRDLCVATVRDLMHALLTLREHSLASSLYEVIASRWDEMKITKPLHILLSEGFIHITTGKLDRAEAVFSEVARRTDEPSFVICAYVNLGLIHRLRGNLDRALTYQMMAWELQNEHGSHLSLQRIANEIARCYMKKGEADAAADWLNAGADTYCDEPEPLIEEERILLEAETALALDPERSRAVLKGFGKPELPPEMAMISDLIQAQEMLTGGRVEDAVERISTVRESLWQLLEIQ